MFNVFKKSFKFKHTTNEGTTKEETAVSSTYTEEAKERGETQEYSNDYIASELHKMKLLFSDMYMEIERLDASVSHGHKALKEICKIWAFCYNVSVSCNAEDDVSEIESFGERIADELEEVIKSDFRAEEIFPREGDAMDYTRHEPNRRDTPVTTISRCIRPGWSYNGITILKAVVE